MILVTGPTGKVGRELVRYLLEFEVNFRVLCRNRKRANQLWPDDEVSLVMGDLDDPASLTKALEGVEKLFMLPPASLEMERREFNLIDQAARAGVQHVVKLSAMGAGTNSPIRICRMHRAIEQKLEDSRMTWTHIRPNFFFQSIFRHKKTMRSEGAICTPTGNGQASMIDARDVALVAATVLTEDGHEGRSYEPTGRESLSFADIARTISSVTGAEIIHKNISMTEAQERMRKDGIADWLIDDRLGLYRIWAGSDAARVSRTVANVARKTPNTFKQFVRYHEADFYLDSDLVSD